MWPLEDQTSSSAEPTPDPTSPALGPQGLRAAYLMARANLFHEDKVCDLADELHSLCPSIFVSPDTIKSELGAKYHAALDKNAKARRLLARIVLTSWTLHPAPGSMVNTPAKDIWALGDFEMVIVCRNVSLAGIISDKVMLAERVPYHPNESQRVIYWTERSVGGQQLVFHQEQIKIADFSDEPRPAWRGNQRFLFVLPLGKPTSPSPPSRHSGYDEAFLYSGHQTAFFLSGAPPSCALELAGLVYLDFADQRIARKKICLPARLPNQCPVCLEDDTVFIVYAFCGHANACRDCMEKVFAVDKVRQLAGHRCCVCRAPFPPDFRSAYLELEQALHSYSLDRQRIQRKHGKYDRLRAEKDFLERGIMGPTSYQEIWNLDIADDEDRRRESLGISEAAYRTLAALDFAALKHVCACLQQLQAPEEWSLVEAYLGWSNPAQFFSVSPSGAYAPPMGAPRPMPRPMVEYEIPMEAQDGF